jgi:hypothetical protein
LGQKVLLKGLMLYKVEVKVAVYPNLTASSRAYIVLVLADSDKTAENKASEIVEARHTHSRERVSALCLGTAEYAIFDEFLQAVLEVG